jgi:hypothetical protein
MVGCDGRTPRELSFIEPIWKPVRRITNRTMFPHIPFHRVNWLVSSFLIETLVLSVTVVPVYLWFFGSRFMSLQ